MPHFPARPFFRSPWLPGRPLALGLALTLLLLGGCRASGPGSPARSVAAFFSKYQGQPGFHSTEWSADLLQRLALVRASKLLGGSDLSNAITGIRTARVLSFVPASSAARDLSRQGLSSEASGLLAADRYTSLAAGSGSAAYNYVVKTSGDKVSELVATGGLPSAADSFVLVQVQGSFTRAQAEALARVLPEVVRETAR